MKARSAILSCLLSALMLVAMQPARASVGWLDRTYGTKGSTTFSLPSGRTETAEEITTGWNGGSITATLAIGSRNNPYRYDTYVRIFSRTRDGAVDTTFNHGHPVVWPQADTPGPITGHVYDLGQRKTDQSVLVFAGGILYEDRGRGSAFVRRLTRSGVVDATYLHNQGSGMTLGVYTEPRMAVLPDGSARICFNPTPWNADPSAVPTNHIDMLALTPSAARDTNFGPNGIKENVVPGMTRCGAMRLDRTGKLVIAGMSSSEHGSLMMARTDTNGVLDPSFDSGGITTVGGARTYAVTHLTLDTDDSMYVGAASYDPDGSRALASVARFYANGHVASSFGYNGIYRYAVTGYPTLTSLNVTRNKRLLLGLLHVDYGSTGGAYHLSGILLRVSGYTGKRDIAFGNNGQVLMPGPTIGALTDSGGRITTASSHQYGSNGYTQVVLQRRRQ